MKTHFLPASILQVAILLLAADVAFAQLAKPATDVLGAHMNYGRGCVACHAPHSGAGANRPSEHDAGTESGVALWGVDAGQLYGKTLETDGGKYMEVLPTSMDESRPDAAGILTCLSCHDGNYAKGAMMRNVSYETLPTGNGRKAVPTLLGTGGANSYMHEHPLGLNAKMGCGGGSQWDCSISGGVVSMNGIHSSRFVNNYGFFVKPGVYQNTAVITCTTCHEPHRMNVVTVASKEVSGLPPGTYATMFFLRGPYDSSGSNPMSNQAAQFCRQCHAEFSNEMNGSSVGTIF